MKCDVLENIKLKTSTREIELHQGQVVVLNNDDIASKLIIEGRITPIGKESCRIYSKVLDDYFWLVATEKERQWFISEGIKDVIYTKEELSKFKR